MYIDLPGIFIDKVMTNNRWISNAYLIKSKYVHLQQQ